MIFIFQANMNSAESMESDENKKLGPKSRSQQFYSKQDIVEQYCLNDKQLQVLNRVRQPPALFGCISSHRVRILIIIITSKYIYLFFVQIRIIILFNNYLFQKLKKFNFGRIYYFLMFNVFFYIQSSYKKTIMIFHELIERILNFERKAY